MKNSKVNDEFTGVAKSEYNGEYYFAKDGIVDYTFTGLGKNVDDKKYYFTKNGKVDYTFTGLGKNIDDGKYYYVKNGKRVDGYTGLAKSAFNGWYYYAEDSVCTYTWTGLAKHPEDKKYHFVKNSKLNDEFTGVAKSEYNGEYYFAKDGIVDYTFTGLGKNIDDGKYCYVENGKWKKTANGFHHDGNGKNYAIKNGVWLEGYDGIYLNPVNGKHYYLINGLWATDYNGTVKYVGTNGSSYWCRIRNGIQLDRTTISYFQQNVGKWAHKKYGGKTFADTGCVPTSLAMVISAINNSVVYPDTIGDYLYSIKEFNATISGTTGVGAIRGAEAWKMNYTYIYSISDMNTELQAGRVLIVNVGPGTWCGIGATHAIVCDGYNNGRTYVYDPAHPDRNGWYDTKKVYGNPSTDNADYAGGTNIFAFW